MQETIIISISENTLLYSLLAAGIAIISSNFPFKKLRRKQATLSAKAVVLHVQTTGSSCRLNQLKVQLQVMPDKGRNFVTEFNTTLSSKSLSLRAGSTILVQYNPHDQKDITMIL